MHTHTYPAVQRILPNPAATECTAFGYVKRIERNESSKNDPAAGSPTATLLRLLPLLDSEYRQILDRPGVNSKTNPPNGFTHYPSQATTGGVYKNQGRIRCVLMKRAYKTFLVHGE
jgi:hypothetical protein